LFFNEDAHHALLNCSASDINLLSKAATLLRKDILNKKQKFTGSFSSSEADTVTDSLLVFMRMVWEGPTPGKIDVPSSSDKIALSLSELIMFNCVGKRSSSSRKLRHNQERETPLPLILAMKIHMKTEQKTLVDTLAERGLCTSYSRTNQIACDLANTAITIWEEEGVVYPLQAEKGVFTTGWMDNIDYNPSSATSQITLHGTGISIVQHHSLATISPHQAHENMINPAVSGKKSVMPLPQSYCGMEDISYVHREKVFVPKTNFDAEIFPFESCEAEILESGYAWLDEVKRLSEQPLAEDDSISWGAYYASLSEPPSFDSRSFMLPLFTEKSW
jgi:hypothetical protein